MKASLITSATTKINTPVFQTVRALRCNRSRLMGFINNLSGILLPDYWIWFGTLVVITGIIESDCSIPRHLIR